LFLDLFIGLKFKINLLSKIILRFY